MDGQLRNAGRAGLAEDIVADQAAHDFRVTADEPDYRVRAKASGRWRWDAWRPEGIRVAVSGDWFHSEKAARDAARLVRQQCCTAIGP